MARSSRHDRGRETEFAVRDYYIAELWPDAQVGGRSEAGSDLLNVPFDVEIKARTQFDPLAWVRQSRKRDVNGYVVMRPNGLGVQSIEDWLVIRRLERDTKILREGGYDLRGPHR